MLTLITTTFATAEDAHRVAEDCVEKKLAVCAQVGAGVSSVYRYRFQTETAREVPLLLKTTPEKQAACVSHLRSLHPYETAAIEWWSVNATPDTLLWASHELA